MKKLLVLIFALLIFQLTACSRESVVMGKNKTYEISSEIHSLNIRIGAAHFLIEHGDSFFVESNLKDLIVSEHNGVLTVEEKHKTGIHNTNAVLKLRVPKNVVFEEIDITTGASNLVTESLSANSVKLILGAGKSEIACLNAYSDADIKGGSGQFTVAKGTLNNLTLKMGVGKLDMNVALHGNCVLSLGVGESNITLIGSKDDYNVDIEKGVGRVSVDGMDISDYCRNPTGKNSVKIACGIGDLSIAFEEE